MSKELLTTAVRSVDILSHDDPAIILSRLIVPKGSQFFDLSPKIRTVFRHDLVSAVANRGFSPEELLFSGYDMNASTDSLWNGANDNYHGLEYPKHLSPEEAWFFADIRGVFAGRGDQGMFNPFHFAMAYRRGMPTVGIYSKDAIQNMGAEAHGPHAFKLCGDLADIDDGAKIADYRVRMGV